MAESISHESMGSSSSTCRTCGVDVHSAFLQVDAARKRLALLQEKLTLDEELLKADKRNFKRRMKAAKASASKSQADAERAKSESRQNEEVAKRKLKQSEVLLKQAEDKAKSFQEKYEREVKVLQARIRKLETEMEAKIKQAREESKQSVDYSARHREAELKAQHEKEVQSLKGKLKDLEDSPVKEAAPASGNDDERLEAAQAEIQRLNDLLDEKQASIESYEMELLELEREREGIMMSQQQKSECSECQRLEETVRQLEADVALLQKQKVTAEKTAQERADAEHQGGIIDDLEEEKLFLAKQLEQAKQDLEKKTALESQSRSTCEALAREVKELKSANKQLQQELKSSTILPSSNGNALLSNETAPVNGSRKMVMEVEWQSSDGAMVGIYTGSMSEQGNPDGSGTLRLDDGAVIDSDWKEGRPHGHGVLATIEGDIYRGEWNEGEMHGRGVYVFSDGRVYRGSYRNNQRHGEGVMTWPYGAHYSGHFVEDKRNGEGEYHYADGRRFKGSYQDDRPHGYGILSSSDGTVIYDGQWELGEFLGQNA